MDQHTTAQVGTEMTKEIKYLTMFDCEGFECMIDITSRERQYLLSTIKGEEYKDDIGLNGMMMRARFNPQRSPEIWVFTSQVSDATIQELKESEPQMLVDLIREHGNCIWKSTPVDRVIT